MWNPATCIYHERDAQLIQLLGLIEPHPDGHQICLSQAEKLFYEPLPLLAKAACLLENNEEVHYKVDTGQVEFDQQVAQVIQAIATRSAETGKLQKLLNLKPVQPKGGASQWFSDNGFVILEHQDLKPCLKVLDSILATPMNFQAFTSEAGANEHRDAGTREFSFRAGDHAYLAVSQSRWRDISTSAASMFFEHEALITKIAGLLLSLGKPARQLMRHVELSGEGTGLQQAFNVLATELAQKRKINGYEKLREFNATVRTIRLSSPARCTTCDRYFNHGRRGKTVLTSYTEALTPLLLLDNQTVSPDWDTVWDNFPKPVLAEPTVPPDWESFPTLPAHFMLPTPSGFARPADKLATEPCITDISSPHPCENSPSVIFTTDTACSDDELITELVEENEFEEFAGDLILPDVDPLAELTEPGADHRQDDMVPGPRASSEAPAVRQEAGLQESAEAYGLSQVSPPAPPTLSLYSHLSRPGSGIRVTQLHTVRSVEEGQKLAADYRLEVLRRSYPYVLFGKNAFLMGTPVLGAGTIIGDNVSIGPWVRLPPASRVRDGVRLTKCQIDYTQVTPPVCLVLSGDPYGTLHHLRLIPGAGGNTVDIGNVGFSLSETTLVPGGVTFSSGAKVNHFRVDGTIMNNCVVRGSLSLKSPILGANVDFGPDVVVEENVTISDNVVFKGENLVAAGSMIGKGVRVARKAMVTGMVSSSGRSVHQMRGQAKPSRRGRPKPERINDSNTMTIAAPSGTPLQAASKPVAGNPVKGPTRKVIDIPGGAEPAQVPEMAGTSKKGMSRKVIDVTGDGDPVQVTEMHRATFAPNRQEAAPSAHHPGAALPVPALPPFPPPFYSNRPTSAQSAPMLGFRAPAMPNQSLWFMPLSGLPAAPQQSTMVDGNYSLRTALADTRGTLTSQPAAATQPVLHPGHQPGQTPERETPAMLHTMAYHTALGNNAPSYPLPFRPHLTRGPFS